jgi:tetratricopeptide (TPR) repeat protein
MQRTSAVFLLPLILCAGSLLFSQVSRPSSDPVQVAPPPFHRAERPPEGASAGELEKRGDELRVEKADLDALDYFRAALAKNPTNPQVWNKAGIVELQLQRYKDSLKSLNRAIKLEPTFANAHNNLGVTYYELKKYRKAIQLYEKAISLDPSSASYYNNLGAAYFSKKEWDKATEAYGRAVQLDPDILARSSRSAVTLISSPQDRAHFQYVLAKLYAKNGLADRSLECLRKAMEDGYKKIDDVYKDAEFTELRKDPRFTQLMASHPLAIPN